MSTLIANFSMNGKQKRGSFANLKTVQAYHIGIGKKQTIAVFYY
jgi:hypothetical protein